MRPLYPDQPRVSSGWSKDAESLKEAKSPRPVLEMLFSFHGRRGRGQWWLFTLGIYIAPYIVIFGLNFLTHVFRSVLWTVKPDGRREFTNFGNAFESFVVILLLVGAVSFVVAALANNIKRLHDTNLSGWLLLFGLLPFVAISFDSTVLMLVAALANLILAMRMALAPGTDGPNTYGEKP